MRMVRISSLQEYASWYLQRQARKDDSHRVPGKADLQIEAMWKCQRDKMRPWFRNASTRWHIVELEAVGDLANLVFLESTWTKEEGLVIPDGTKNYRLLCRVAENAMANRYLERPSAREHKKYYDSLSASNLQLGGEDRIAICSAEPTEIESNPAASYYLLDGVGRCLPYMILLKERKLEYMPIEAFRAERDSTENSGR